MKSISLMLIMAVVLLTGCATHQGTPIPPSVPSLSGLPPFPGENISRVVAPVKKPSMLQRIASVFRRRKKVERKTKVIPIKMGGDKLYISTPKNGRVEVFWTTKSEGTYTLYETTNSTVHADKVKWNKVAEVNGSNLEIKYVDDTTAPAKFYKLRKGK